MPFLSVCLCSIPSLASSPAWLPCSHSAFPESHLCPRLCSAFFPTRGLKGLGSGVGWSGLKQQEEVVPAAGCPLVIGP